MMPPILQRIVREPLLVGGANFAVGWLGIIFRVAGLRPEPKVQIALAVGALLLLLPLNLISAKHFAGYSGPRGRVYGRLFAMYEAVGLLGIGVGWVILHAP